MNGSLPPSSRLTRATRSAHTLAIRLPVADRAGEGDAVDALVGDDRARRRRRRRRARLTTPGGQVLEAAAPACRVESGVSSDGLQTRRVAGRQRRRELPGEQQQRVVPRHDAGDDAERLLEHQRQLGRLDRRDHAARRVAADLGVVVERGRGPADLVAVLDQRLAALARHQSRRARRCRARSRAATSCSSSPRSTAGVARPRRARPRRAAAIAASTCSAEAPPTRGDRLLRERVLDRERRAVAGDRARRRSAAALSAGSSVRPGRPAPGGPPAAAACAASSRGARP